MNKLEQAARQALEALESAPVQYDFNSYPMLVMTPDTLQTTLTALREALAQPQDHSEQHLNMVQGEWVDLTAQEKANIIYAADHRNPMAMLNEALSLLKDKNAPQICKHGCDDNACPECYFEHTEPIAKVCHDLAGHIGWNPDLDELPEEGALLYTTPPVVPQGEPVAWMNTKYATLHLNCEEAYEEYYLGKAYEAGELIPLYTTPPSVEAAIEATKAKVLACYSLGDTYQNWVDKIKEIK